MLPTTKESTDIDKVARALTGLIDLIDYWRPSWRFFHRPLYSGPKLEKYDPNFPRDILQWIKGHYKALYKVDITEAIIPLKVVSTKESYLMSKHYVKEMAIKKKISYMPYLIYILFFIAAILLFDVISESYPDYFLYNSIFSLIVFGLMLCSSISFAVCFNTAYYKIQKGREYDSELLGMAQRTIDYAREYFRKNNINPRHYPIKLAFNDYPGLTYEKKGMRYLAFIKVD